MSGHGPDGTLQYYTDNAADFVARTLGLSMEPARDSFLALMPETASILDLGCGSGRDSLAFLNAGHRVEAVDGSPEMCAAAGAHIGQPVRQLLFEQLDYVDEFDGVWACCSLLHVPSTAMPGILRRLHAALRKDGVVYLSFKYGEFEGWREGRHFTDYTEDRLAKLFQGQPWRVHSLWQSRDERPGRTQPFVNLLAFKM